MDTYRIAITGADRGLGLALSRELAARGHTVYAGEFDRKEQSLRMLQQLYPENIVPLKLDCSSDVSIKHFVGEAYRQSSGLDILINNAAILGDIETGIDGNLDFDEMQKVFQINTLAPLRLTQAALPMLRTGAGRRIAYISSEAASIGSNFRDRWFAYCMSKAALNRQAALIYEALKADGFSVLCLHPGHLRTHMRGALDTTADLMPEDVAVSLIDLIINPPKPFGFWDFQGKELDW